MATIRFDIDTVRATDTGSALGQIWIEFADRSLPCPRWDDFLVFVLDWWRLGIRTVLAGLDEPAIFAFMDDPYEVWLRPADGGYSFTLTFHDKEIASGTEDRSGVRELVKSYCDCVSVVLERIQQDNGWRNSYAGSLSQIEDLKAELPQFQRLLEQFEAA